jgi:hypothetical protein
MDIYMYSLGLPANTWVKVVAVYVVVNLIVMEILYFAVWCRPFTGYWEVPPSDRECLRTPFTPRHFS